MTEQLHQISIPGLPDGWRAVAWRYALKGECCFDKEIFVVTDIAKTDYPLLIIEKIKPRRIVLEETGEVNNKLNAPHRNIFDGVQIFTDEKADVCLKVIGEKIWREVVEQVNEETK